VSARDRPPVPNSPALGGAAPSPRDGSGGAVAAPGPALERRRVLGWLGAAISGSAAAGCAAPGVAPADGPDPAAACEDDLLAAALARTPDGRLDVRAAEAPQRQDDPRWAGEVMWDRARVLRAAVELEGEEPSVAAGWLRAFEDGNTVGNEGCMLTCLSMVLRLLGPPTDPPWTPGSLNAAAQERLYYRPSGLSLTTLYADLVAELTLGAVQLAIKVEYLPGEPGWARVTASRAPLVRAYRALPPARRASTILMLKTGTWDDTVASHYALLHPEDVGGPDDDDPTLLDPAQPLEDTSTWRLSDSAAQITIDPEIDAAWRAAGIGPTQLGGVWVFTRWDAARGRAALAPLVASWAKALAGAG
jgi:hypothetical protein